MIRNRSTHAERVFPIPGLPIRANERGVAVAAGLDIGFRMVLMKDFQFVQELQPALWFP